MNIVQIYRGGGEKTIGGPTVSQSRLYTPPKPAAPIHSARGKFTAGEPVSNTLLLPLLKNLTDSTSHLLGHFAGWAAGSRLFARVLGEFSL